MKTMPQTSSQKIEGVIPPMMTPFHENEEVDYKAFVRNIERWNKEPLAGYLVLGSNSEAAYLTEHEKIKLIKLTVEHTPKGRIVLAGTGLESTKETLRLTEKAGFLGVRGALVLTPSYYHPQMTDSALIAHFTYLADHSAIPILIYNVPRFTHVNISLDAVRTLSQHPNIIGMKDSSGDVAQLELFLKNVSSHFQVIVGTAASWYPALQMGVTAGIFAVANFAGNKLAAIQSDFKAGRTQQAEECYRKLLPVNAAVTATYGVPGMKYAATLMGYEGGYVRRPLLPLSNVAQQDVQTIFKKAELLS